MDGDDRVIRADILIDAGRITAIEEKIATRGVDRVIDARQLVVMPGLIQAHTHVCQTLFRGQAEGMDVLTWLRERIWPLEGALGEKEIRAAARLGFCELLCGGTTTVLDIGTVHHTDILFEEAARLGIRYIGGKTMMDQGHGYPAALRETTEESLIESERLCKRWHGAEAGRLRYAFAPRSVLSASDRLIRGAVERARKHGALLTTHVAESAEEVSLARERVGHGQVTHLHSLGFAGTDVILAHGVWLTAAERRIMQETDTRLAHCPSANLKLGSGIARITELVSDGILVGLGAGGAACNDNLDGFVEMRLAALIHKAHGGAGAVRAATALRMATWCGAMSLGLEACGSIETGKIADLILLDLCRPHVWPDTGDLRSRVVYAAHSSDVHTVLVGGEVVVDKGELVRAKVTSILEAARESAARLVAPLA